MSRSLKFLVVILGLTVALPVLAQSPTEQSPLDQPAQVDPVQQQQQDPMGPVEGQEEGQEPVAQTSEQAEGELTGAGTGELDQQASSAEQVGDASDAAGEERMPKTASPLALLALLGGAGVGSAFGLRHLRRR